MTALFWWVIASSWVQAFAGVVLLAALVLAIVMRWVPGAAAYAAAARFASYIAVAVLGLGIGYRSADETAALRQAQTDLAFSQLQLNTQRQTADVATKLRADAEATAAQANQKVADYESDLADEATAGSGCDIDRRDNGRLLDIAQ
jgi:hypothetical protein